MARGYPDWMTDRYSTTYIVHEDLAELAARLGSVDTYDRSGKVILFDSFETTWGLWQKVGNTCQCDISYVYQYSRTGLYSLRFVDYHDTGGAVGVYRLLQFPRPVNCGYEISFTIHNYTKEVRILVEIWDGYMVNMAGIKYNHQQNKVYYFGHTGNWIAFAESCSLPSVQLLYHTMKFVIDFQNKTYIRCLLDSYTQRFREPFYYGSDTVQQPYQKFSFWTSVSYRPCPYVYVDDFIYTENEE